ncbi:uncharacterized [Tachysurus ichikawai]
MATRAVRRVAQGFPKKHNSARVDAPPSLPVPTAQLFDALFYLQASLLYYTSGSFCSIDGETARETERDAGVERSSSVPHDDARTAL